jgi:hypothetical protein
MEIGEFGIDNAYVDVRLSPDDVEVLRRALGAVTTVSALTQSQFPVAATLREQFTELEKVVGHPPVKTDETSNNLVETVRKLTAEHDEAQALEAASAHLAPSAPVRRYPRHIGTIDGSIAAHLRPTIENVAGRQDMALRKKRSTPPAE